MSWKDRWSTRMFDWTKWKKSNFVSEWWQRNATDINHYDRWVWFLTFLLLYIEHSFSRYLYWKYTHIILLLRTIWNNRRDSPTWKITWKRSTHTSYEYIERVSSPSLFLLLYWDSWRLWQGYSTVISRFYLHSMIVYAVEKQDFNDFEDDAKNKKQLVHIPVQNVSYSLFQRITSIAPSRLWSLSREREREREVYLRRIYDWCFMTILTGQANVNTDRWSIGFHMKWLEV
jgi:hypothetical protein